MITYCELTGTTWIDRGHVIEVYKDSPSAELELVYVIEK